MTGQDPFYLDDASTRGLRSESRDSLFIVGNIRVAGGVSSESIRIRNLSASGLMAESTVLYAVGTLVIIEFKNIQPVTGRVVWSIDGRMGISFEREIDPKTARQMMESKKLDIPDHIRHLPARRPGLKIS